MIVQQYRDISFQASFLFIFKLSLFKFMHPIAKKYNLKNNKKAKMIVQHYRKISFQDSFLLSFKPSLFKFLH